MQTTARLAYALSVVALALGAGCSGSSTKHVDAYLASEHCSQSTSQSACAAESDCHWVATGAATTTVVNPGGPCLNQAGPQTAPGCILSPGVCAPNDPCLALDKHACAGDTSCAWSQTTTLCPVGASCNDGGYCHASGGSGGSCACVSPIACPANGPCPPVECDCSGGGQGDGGTTGGGGSCTCSCPACAPGQDCAPCDCDCTGGSPGCQDMGGTCACSCPACLVGQDCPACDCNCGGGPVTGTDPCNQFTDAQSCEHNGQYNCGVAPGPGGEFLCVTLTPSSSDPCAAHSDQASCQADTANDCGFVVPPCSPPATSSSCPGSCQRVGGSSTDPCTQHDPSACAADTTNNCVEVVSCSGPPGNSCIGVCAQATPVPPACNCPACPAGSACNCACASPPTTPPSTICPPPPVPTPTPAPPVACPQLNCPALQCANGTATDANGCPTCTCL